MLTQKKLQSQATDPKNWDKPTTQATIGDYIREPFQPIMVVVDKDLLPDGRVRLLAKPVSASYTQEWIVDPELAEPSVGNKSLSCELQPAWNAYQEYEKGKSHGKFDAAARIKPICTEVSCAFSTGYLDGYHHFTIADEQFTQLPKPKKTMEWRVVYAPDWDWDWYVLWVGGECIGRYSSCEEAECAAQKYVAAELARLEHRELVLSAYAE